jgi:Asp-tRNA(Asn)/Glu-tRNA(Gln) amidotransferase A subunit family amidase
MDPGEHGGARFDPTEATVREIHDAMRAGEVTAEELVEHYCNRIEVYDRANAEINSIVTINADAKTRARELDDQFESEGFSGPLHGIPVVVKDQAMTAGLRTTFGSEAFETYVPDTDATIIENLKLAGAIILAKTAMNDWAAGSSGISSILGQTKNPYALDRDPGGSSSGTGAAVAASFGTVGVGEDTGGSIRAPASSCNLFGIRVTTGLVSRTGLSPLVARQDTPGPMARTVEDLVRLLDVLVGFDPADPYTSRNSIPGTDSYLDSLEEDGLKRARIGVLRQGFGDDDDESSAPVNRILETTLERFDEIGAELVDPVSIPDLTTRLEETSLYEFQSRYDITAFLRSLDDAPIDSFDDFYNRGAYHEKLTSIDRIADGPNDPFGQVEYWKAVEAQQEFQHAILSVFAEHDLDAIAFPDTKVVPRYYADLPQDESEENYLTNTLIASQSSCPAISMPAGFTEAGLPVGIELVGTPYSEQRLLSLAADYESRTDTRRPPATTPPLD